MIQELMKQKQNSQILKLNLWLPQRKPWGEGVKQEDGNNIHHTTVDKQETNEDLGGKKKRKRKTRTCSLAHGNLFNIL